MFFLFQTCISFHVNFNIYISDTLQVSSIFSGPVIRHITECNTIHGRGLGRDVIRSIKYTWKAEVWLSKQTVLVF